MNPAGIKLLHVAPRARGIGGIETLLARHARTDGAHFDATQIGLFDRAGGGETRFHPQGFGWRNTPLGMRAAMRPVLARHAGSVAIWHNAWGLPWFADLDGASRRIVVLHAHRDYFADWLPAVRGHLDGILAVSPAIARDAAALLPDWPGERIGVLPLPIARPAGLRANRRTSGPWVIGCAGRLARAQKRWDRLVLCVAELRRLGLDFRIEIIGDGALRPWLEREFRGDAAVTFLGFVDTAEYWRRLATWDAALFFSDVEGGPIVMLEAMAAGVLPVYPQIGGSVGDDYAPQIDPRCHYPAGDPVAAARALHALLALAPAELEATRTRAQALAAPHDGDGYERSFAAFVRRIVALPRSARPSTPRPGRWSDALPLGAITRLLPGALWR
ncbi:glycosyltransferase [Horticoccus sp. 23ND18S-11]|uniref:glycosyltransferase n=1 Tax=Horticoccus sp. 23ND18S-11 TaxID=3391832 RepID=UPI0039C8EDA4